ncbi:MAG TPA: universal stress protein [Acidimicrobiales bacterium]|nr:universal stress protein [Acidimicrobiales bacterium]
MGAIVAGVDGSEPSRRALRWALAEASMRGSEVLAVHVWRFHPLSYAGAVAAPVLAAGDLEAAAHTLLDQEVDAAVAEAAGRPAVERVVAEGAPAEQLVKLAAGADLLVVGHRGHGGFPSLLLGSVAQQCSTHASCPVVILR